eukprot:3221664-Rhodomonas_salina.1
MQLIPERTPSQLHRPNQFEETTSSVLFVPGMWFPAIEFALDASSALYLPDPRSYTFSYPPPIHRFTYGRTECKYRTARTRCARCGIKCISPHSRDKLYWREGLRAFDFAAQAHLVRS